MKKNKMIDINKLLDELTLVYKKNKRITKEEEKIQEIICLYEYSDFPVNTLDTTPQTPTNTPNNEYLLGN